MSRMKELKSLATAAKEEGDEDKYNLIRGDIFKEFDFDIGKYSGKVFGGRIKKKKRKKKLTNYNY